MDSRESYEICLGQATAIVRQVRPEQFANETPDTDWSVRDLLQHMLYEVSWVPDMTAGKTMAEVGDKFEGDLMGSDPAALADRWGVAANLAEQAAARADLGSTAHLSYTDTTNGEYLKMTGGDVLVHAWDLAKAIGAPMSFPPVIAADMWSRVKDLDMSGSRLFKPPVAVAEDASDQDKILGHFGRDPAWRPSKLAA